MLSPKSLRGNFLVKLAVALAVLLGLFSIFLYFDIRRNVQNELEASLIKHARFLLAKKEPLETLLPKQREVLRRTLKIDTRILPQREESHMAEPFEWIHQGKKTYLRGFFPYHDKVLQLDFDVSQPIHTVEQVFRSILLVNLLAMGLIILYAYFLSRMLVAPVTFFVDKLRKMNENLLEPLDLESIPLEFRPLGQSFNQLVGRIKSHLLYKKELFVGTAHELKTPLAVVKTRSQVALLKRDPKIEALQDALRGNIETVDRMNEMVGAILQFGRAEGAQFETPRTIDLVEFLKKTTEEFQLLAHNENKQILTRFSPEHLEMTLQPLLLQQILQNLLQNALRYTPPGGTLRLHSYLENDHFILSIRDEGPGIDESVDLFSPFKRGKESPGAGLGLFLVRSAVDTLGGSIELRNRRNGRGAIAILRLPLDGRKP